MSNAKGLKDHSLQVFMQACKHWKDSHLELAVPQPRRLAVQKPQGLEYAENNSTSSSNLFSYSLLVQCLPVQVVSFWVSPITLHLALMLHQAVLEVRALLKLLDQSLCFQHLPSEDQVT